jgi:hypothetical protein
MEAIIAYVGRVYGWQTVTTDYRDSENYPRQSVIRNRIDKGEKTLFQKVEVELKAGWLSITNPFMRPIAFKDTSGNLIRLEPGQTKNLRRKDVRLFAQPELF